MLENFLLQIGMKCGTVKNFNSTIANDMRLNAKQHWYFLTPIKTKESGSLLKVATIQIAFPFLAIKEDISEADVIKRLTPLVPEYQNSLIANLRKMLIVPECTFSIIPFWANEKGTERNERKDFGNSTIHIINAQVTVKYRASWFNCEC